MTEVSTSLSNFWNELELKPFKPSAFYIKELDCLWCLTRDCPYVATPTCYPYVERLVDKGETVGFKIWHFLTLPSEMRHGPLELIGTMMDLDDLKGIEYIYIHTANEQDAEISAEEVAFFDWLKAPGKSN